MVTQDPADARVEVERLREEMQERDDFLALMAHELRNPMHALSLQLASVRTLAEASGARAIVERIVRTQATLSRYIDRATVLLDVAQHQQRAYPVSLKSVDLAALLRRIADQARTEAEFHGVNLRLDLPPAVEIQSDPLAIEHVVGNLLSNAFKHSRCTEVQMSLRIMHAFAQIDVADNGRGISSDDQQRVFEKFERGALPALQAGSGLGLWIARRLIEALDGTISLESRLNEGCRFVVRIPITGTDTAS